MRIVVDRPLRI